MRTVIINDSSIIRMVEYIPEKQLMFVVFMDGTIYEYRDVPTQEFMTIVGSQSVGGAANAFFRRNPGQKVEYREAFLSTVTEHINDNLSAWREQYE